MSKLSENLPNILVIGALILGAGGVAVQKFLLAPDAAANRVEVHVPESFSAKAQVGKIAFNATCAECHGVNAAGTNKGPPFINPIYNPGHHDDESFYSAVQNGVQRHHWNFGDMPAQPKVSEQDAEAIIAYVRELQEANGIVYEEHHM